MEYREGQTATHPDGRKIVFRGGQWVNAPNSQKTAKKPLASAEARTRLSLGLGPSIEAQKNLYKEEQWGEGTLGKNPMNTVRGALADFVDGPDNNAGALAKWIGGEKYARYNQASKTFESAFLPILSGAAVTDSEAQRMIRASLPQRGDSAEILARKAKNRAQMINSAAAQVGEDAPFQRTPTPGVVPEADARAATQRAKSSSLVSEARAAIARGAPRAAVMQRLQQMGVDPRGL